MLVELADRFLAGFTFMDWMVLLMASIVGALVMTRWSQLTAIALIAYGADLAFRFAGLFLSAGDVPMNFAAGLAMARLDDHGLAAALRPFLFFALIAFLFGLRRRYARK